jgi:hypothetical protein
MKFNLQRPDYTSKSNKTCRQSTFTSARVQERIWQNILQGFLPIYSKSYSCRMAWLFYQNTGRAGYELGGTGMQNQPLHYADKRLQPNTISLV